MLALPELLVMAASDGLLRLLVLRLDHDLIYVNDHLLAIALLKRFNRRVLRVAPGVAVVPRVQVHIRVGCVDIVRVRPDEEVWAMWKATSFLLGL